MGENFLMKPQESPRIRKNQLVVIRVIRGLCGIGVKDEDRHILFTVMTLIQTIDNLKKKVPHAQIRGSTLFL